MSTTERTSNDDHLQYLLTAYLFESISKSGKREVESHLAACAECRAELEELRATLLQVKDAIAPGPGGSPAGESYSFEARRLERVLAAAKDRGPWRWIVRRRLPLGIAAAILGMLSLLPMVIKTRGGTSVPGVGIQNVTEAADVDHDGSVDFTVSAGSTGTPVASVSPKAAAPAAAATNAEPMIEQARRAGEPAGDQQPAGRPMIVGGSDERGYPGDVTVGFSDLDIRTKNDNAEAEKREDAARAPQGASQPGGGSGKSGEKMLSPGSITGNTGQAGGGSSIAGEDGNILTEDDRNLLAGGGTAHGEALDVRIERARKVDVHRSIAALPSIKLKEADDDKAAASREARVLRRKDEGERAAPQGRARGERFAGKPSGGGGSGGPGGGAGGSASDFVVKGVTMATPELGDTPIISEQLFARSAEAPASAAKPADTPPPAVNVTAAAPEGSSNTTNFGVNGGAAGAYGARRGGAGSRNELKLEKEVAQAGTTAGTPLTLSTTDQVQGLVTAFELQTRGHEEWKKPAEGADLGFKKQGSGKPAAKDQQAFRESFEGDASEDRKLNTAASGPPSNPDALVGAWPQAPAQETQMGRGKVPIKNLVSVERLEERREGDRAALGAETPPVVTESAERAPGDREKGPVNAANSWVRLNERQPRDGLMVGEIVREQGLNDAGVFKWFTNTTATEGGGGVEGEVRVPGVAAEEAGESLARQQRQEARDKATGAMVTVENRFLDVQDQFLKEVGVQDGAVTQYFHLDTSDLQAPQNKEVKGLDGYIAGLAKPDTDRFIPTQPGLSPAQQAAPEGWSFYKSIDLGGNDGGGQAAPGQQIAQGQQAPHLAAALQLRRQSAVELGLRAFQHYRSLDPTLKPEVFFSQAITVQAPTVGDEGLGEEGFKKRYGVNPFVDTARDHLSTFGMDVDTASYTLARGAVAAGKLPDPKTVRVEEFVNYFREEMPADPDAVFAVRCEGGPSAFGDGLDLLKITVKARELLPGERKDAVLTFAIDTSGSMNLGDRLSLVKQALETLVRSLKPEDRVGIVAFGATPYLVLPHTPARERERISGAVRSLVPGGGTNVEAGLALAYRVADEVFEKKAVNRVVLCSDGVANVGARGPGEILRKAEVFAKRGVYLSCAGFGMGKYSDAMLETLANKGNGNYAYVDSPAAAAEVFQKNLPSTLQVLALDAKIQVDFNPEVVTHYRLLGYENRDIADKDFRNDKVDAGEVGPGSTVTVLYEVRRKASASGDLGRIHLRYRDAGTGRVDELNYPLPPAVIATSLRETSDRFRFTASAAETAELFRQSYWARNGSLGKVLGVLGTVSAEYRARPEWRELVELVTRAQALVVTSLASMEKSTENNTDSGREKQ